MMISEKTSHRTSTPFHTRHTYSRGAVWLVAALVLLASCQSGPNPTPTDGRAKEANNIVPGRSEWVELLAALPEGSFEVHRGATLTRVQFPVDSPNDPDDRRERKATPTPFPRLTLQQVIEARGTPERAYGWLERGGSMICQVVILEYPARGLRVESFTCGPLLDVKAWEYPQAWLRADPRLPVFRIDYYPPCSFEKALRDVYGLGNREVKCLLSKPRWQGLDKVPEASECR